MPANSVSRKTIRDYLVGILAAALVDGTPAGAAQQVVGYHTGDFAKTPIVAVPNAGVARNREHMGADSHDTFIDLDIFTFVRYAIPETGWTEADAEDRLDLLEKKITDVVTDHRSKNQDAAAPWDSLKFVEPSAPDSVVVGGVEYRRERFRVRARVLHG